MTASELQPDGLRSHLVACAVGAGLDNLFRQVVMVALAAAALHSTHDHAQAQITAQAYVNWAMVLVTVPFIALSPLAGSLGDRYPKQRIIQAARIADLPVCAFGVWGFASGSVPLMLASLAGLAIASSFFAPVKLAVVPELVPMRRLAPANSLLAAVTVCAILFGTCLSALTDAGKITAAAHWWSPVDMPAAIERYYPAIILAVVSALCCAIGIISAFRLPRLPAQSPERKLAPPWAVVEQINTLSSAPGLWAPAISLAGFWGVGTAVLVGLVPLATDIYGYGQAGIAGLFFILVIGVITGSVTAPRLIARAFQAGLPIVGAFVAGAAFVMIGLHAHADSLIDAKERNAYTVAIWLFTCGVGAGWWEVPLVILLQERAPAERRNLIMAGVSALGSLGQIASVALIATFSFIFSKIPWCVAWGAPTTQCFIAIGALTVVAAIGFAIVYRLQLTAWIMASLVKRIWRVRVLGTENVPATGGCLVICNHLSFADGVVMASSLPRPGRFLVYRAYVEMPVIGFLLRAAGVIPVAGEDKRKALLASIDAAIEAAKSGECVVIFPEGKLTRTGHTDAFRSGMERIAGRAGVPVVPAFLHGLWGGPFSRAPRKDWPRLFRRLELRIGPPLAPATTAPEARAHVMSLSYEHAQERSDRDRRTLGSAFLSRAKRHPFTEAVRDASGALSHWKLAALARALFPLLGIARDERTVGIVLPPGRAGTIVNAALAIAGRTAVNLNHTAGEAQLARMCELAGVRTIVSSKLYLRRIGDPKLVGRVVTVEELLPNLGRANLLLAAATNMILPSRWSARGNADDSAAIIFSSGSTGDPKGIELSHRQIIANCRAVADGLDLHLGRDVLLSPLPLFHSFGLVPGMWLGLVEGLAVAAQPDPTDGKALGELAAAAKATFLISTPTFVRGYLRRIEPEQFKHLRFAVVGAERCPADLKAQFKERFKADLLEGYGCTELAPTVAVNLPDVARDGVKEARSKDGTVGRPLPGIHTFAMDPATRAPLAPGSEGLLVVRSASRMKGYLGRPDLTEAAFVHGGYITGDIGKVDDDGFVSITGRLARFAKIGGEMVPLDNVESALQTAVGEACELAVAAVPDEGRGERLVVLHTPFPGDWEAALKTLEALPALWRPKPRDLRPVESIPKLGTGKRDLAAIKRQAAALLEKKSATP